MKHEIAGLLWLYKAGEPFPNLPTLDGLRVELVHDREVLLSLIPDEEEEIDNLLKGSTAYVANLNGVRVALGWSTVGETTFGEPPHPFVVPAQMRYLRGFVTLPEWRGRGIYPHLLQAIIKTENAEEFWVLHQFANYASERGIEKAGFSRVAKIVFLDKEHVQLGISALNDPVVAQEGATLLNLPSV